MDNVKEYKGFLVYSDGRVYRPETTYTRTDGVKRTFKGQFLQKRIRTADKGKGGGYEYVDLYFEGGKKEYWLVHRLIAKLFVPNPQDLPQVNHKDGDRSNNNFDNLEWVSCSENQKHAYKELKRTRKGKLTDEDYRQIKHLRDTTNLTLNAIANIYGIDFRVVSDIAKGNRFCLREEGN